MSDLSGVNSSSSTASLLAQLRQQFLARPQAGNAQNQSGVSATNQPSGVSAQPDSDGDSDKSAAAVAGTTSAATAVSGSNSPSLSPNVLTVLILTQEQTGGTVPSQGSAPGGSGFDQQFISALDSNTNSDGTITEAELEKAVSAVGGTAQQADQLFNQLDPNGGASINASDVTSALKHGHHGGHHHHDADAASGSSGGSSSGSDPLSALLQNASSTQGTGTTVTNPDGSTTTTLTYADGTKVTVTTPATNVSSASGSGSTQPTGASTDGSGATQPSLENVLTTLIRLQEQAFQPATTALGQAA
jgi:hypothetical protein